MKVKLSMELVLTAATYEEMFGNLDLPAKCCTDEELTATMRKDFLAEFNHEQMEVVRLDVQVLEP